MSLRDFYDAYLDCLNRQAWDDLGSFVAERARHNGRDFGLSGYRDMLVRDFEEIPDLHFKYTALVCEAPFVAARLQFDVTPRGTFLGVAVNGRRVSFAENVIYRLAEGKIAEVWSIVDKAALEAQV